MSLALEMVGKPLLWVLGILLDLAKGRDVCSGHPQEAKSHPQTSVGLVLPAARNGQPFWPLLLTQLS